MRLLTFSLALGAVLALAALPGSAQQAYKNITNRRFRTVSNGPQNALIVDVADPTDMVAVHKAVMDRYRTFVQARQSVVQREIANLTQHGLMKRGQHPAFADTVIVRSHGKLQLPDVKPRSGNDLTFNVATTGTGAFSTTATDLWNAQNVASLINLIYQPMKNVLGSPGWSGTVTVRNLDPTVDHGDEIVGAVLIINGNSGEIDFPSFSTYGTGYLAMAQTIAQAFHGPLRTSYDAWETGMARAAAVALGASQASTVQQTDSTFNPANGFFYTPDYDELNEPALGNNTFFPPTLVNGSFAPATLSGMLLPRLEMASTAWLKCYIENPSFFVNFNQAYYAAYAADPTVANDVNRLRELAASVLPKVELQPFDAWYEQQYVLDTSVTPGRKLYVYTQPTFPSSTTANDAGVDIFAVYYDTTTAGDELPASGAGNVVYWENTYTQQLSLNSSPTLNITDGFGSVAPYFTGVGQNPIMRIAIDVPINKEYQRVNFPSSANGTETQPTAFSGVIVGANSGNLQVTYDGGSGAIPVTVAQGAFAAPSNATVPNGFSRTGIQYTSGNTTVKFQRNTAFNNTYQVSPIFVLTVPAAVTTQSHTFAPGPQMISMPVQPLSGDMAAVLGIPASTALLAQYRQDLNASYNYLQYPSLPLYQPGYGLWSNFPQQFTASAITGSPTDNQQSVTIGLENGWNQIGDPYSVAIPFLGSGDGNLTFEDQGGGVYGYTGAVNAGLIAAGIIGYSPDSGYYDITGTPPAGIPVGQLVPWQGYWIRVLVSEGVSLTYTSPNYVAPQRKAARRAVMVRPDGWRVPLILADENGNASSGVFGQASRGSEMFVPALDAASPPAFSTVSSLGVRFVHSDWDTSNRGVAGQFLSDIRRLGTSSQWDVTVSVPKPDKNYTITWNNTAQLPRGTRLMLIDKTTGSQTLMNSSSSLSFRAGKTETSRQFTVVATPHSLGSLRISNLVALFPASNRGRAATAVTIAYELSSPANTTVQIYMGGRVIRHIVATRAAAVGLNQMVWDTKDDLGRTLSAGAYSLEITARTPEGEVTRSVVPLLLPR